MRKPKKQKKPLNELNRSLTPFDPNETLIGVVELSKSSWLVAGIIPGVERQPLKKLAPDEDGLLKLLERWRAEAAKAGHKITRIAVAFETGRDGFWLARWLRARGIEAHVIHAASVPVSREHRRAKTDRLDTEQLKRSFLGWLRGERDHCKMAAIPTFAEEDAKRPHRERETLVGEQTTIINRIKSTLARLGIRSFNPTLKEAAGAPAHARGRADPAQHARRIEPRPRAQAARRRADPPDREGAHGTTEAGTKGWTKSDAPRSDAGDRHWHRDRGHAGQGDLVAQPARPPGGGTLRRARPTKAGSREKGLARSAMLGCGRE